MLNLKIYCASIIKNLVLALHNLKYSSEINYKRFGIFEFQKNCDQTGGRLTQVKDRPTKREREREREREYAQISGREKL